MPATPNPFAPPPGVRDPMAQTATAAVLFGFVNPADPFAQTATAQALFGLPPVDPFAQTATAQALLGPVSPVITPSPDAVIAALPPGVVITVTATPASPAQRPIAVATPLPPSDASSIFRAIANGAAAALVFAGIAGGVVLFLLLAGVLAGISIGNPGPPKYELVEDPSIDPAAQTDFLDKPAATASTASPAAAHDEEWPASLP